MHFDGTKPYRTSVNGGSGGISHARVHQPGTSQALKHLGLLYFCIRYGLDKVGAQEGRG